MQLSDSFWRGPSRWKNRGSLHSIPLEARVVVVGRWAVGLWLEDRRYALLSMVFRFPANLSLSLWRRRRLKGCCCRDSRNRHGMPRPPQITSPDTERNRGELTKDRPQRTCQCIAIQGEKDIQEFNTSPMGTEWQTSEIETALVFFFGFRFGVGIMLGRCPKALTRSSRSLN